MVQIWLNLNNTVNSRYFKVHLKLLISRRKFVLLYFIGCKTEVFSFQNNPKDLDPSCKTDLDPCDCLGRAKLVLKQNFIELI